MSGTSETVKVVVRCRPMNNTEKQNKFQQIVNVSSKLQQIVIKNNAEAGDHTFTYDLVYQPDCLQEDIYKDIGYPIIESVLQGYNGTIFAYGQTGTGKSHTMTGIEDDPVLKGITPRSFEQIFHAINGSPDLKFLVRCSYLQIYNEEVRDLLSTNEKKLDIHEKPGQGVYVKDLQSFIIQEPSELNKKLNSGLNNRKTSKTDMNATSSRSHSIFTVYIETAEQIEGKTCIKAGKLNLVDLAGSERQQKTGAVGDRLKEAININQSLTTLGNVISQLVDGKSTHISYRDSKLTRLLQDSLGGNTKTVMVANIGPCDFNYDETLCTLRYANRAKKIKNKPKINEDPKDAMLRQYQEEIDLLKKQLQDGGLEDTIEGGGNKVIKKEIIKEEIDEEGIRVMEQKIIHEKDLIHKKAEEERKKINSQLHMQDNEKKQILEKLRKKEQAEMAQQDKQEKLVSKLKKMELKVLHGKSEMQEALEKERELRRIEHEMEEKREAQKRMEEEILEKAELAGLKEQKYKNQQEERIDKQKKLKILFQKVKNAEQENNDINALYADQIEDLQNINNDLQKELKKKKLIIDYFIPEKYYQQLYQLSEYREQFDQWTFPNQKQAGNHLLEDRRLQRQEIEQQQMESDQQYEIFKLQKEGHQNVYYTYTDEGLVREDQIHPQDRQYIQQKKDNKKEASLEQTSEWQEKISLVIQYIFSIYIKYMDEAEFNYIAKMLMAEVTSHVQLDKSQ